MLIRLAQTLSAEQAHRAAILGLRAAGGLMPPAPTHANLAIDCGLGRKMPSPIGLAAGFDKDAEAIIGTQKLGFGAIEVEVLRRKPSPAILCRGFSGCARIKPLSIATVLTLKAAKRLSDSSTP